MYKTIILLIIIALFLTVIEMISKEKVNDIVFMDCRYTDRLRGIAAVLVVISHVSGLTGTRIATPLGGIGVAIFLICSGYGMYNSYIKRGLEGFWRGKIKRILIPYWIAVALYYAIRFDRSVFNIEGIAKNVLLINPIPYLWYVQYLMIFNVVFWCFFKIVPERKRILAVLAVSLLFLLFIKNDMYAEQSFSFVTGLILGKFFMSNKMGKKKALKTGGAFLAVSVIFLGIKQFPHVRNSFYMIMNVVQMLIKLCGACGILYITCKIGAIWNKAFVSIGKCSYEIYIVHTLLIPCLVDSGVNIMSMLFYLAGCGVGVILLHRLLQSIQKFSVVKIKPI